MKQSIFTLGLLLSLITSRAQMYFPPILGSDWQNTDPSELGWCTESIPELYQYLEDQKTKAFLVLKDGKIIMEQYFGTFTRDSTWYWASAGKSLTAFMLGLAQEEGKLKLEDMSSTYLGTAWTSCTPEQEQKISIRHHLSMSTGLNDRVADHHCTLDTCLQYLAEPGTRWAYHNAPYTLLDQVIESATGIKLNSYVYQKLQTSTGISGLFIKLGYNNVFFSKPRSMARFGLLMLNEGNWNGTAIMQDSNYFHAMTNTSQDMNPSYGYLWWLNGKSSVMVPGIQLKFPGPLAPQAPEDMYAALGKNGQILHVVPSQNLVLVRMGEAISDSEVSLTMSDSIWLYLNKVICNQTGSLPSMAQRAQIEVYPNPSVNGIAIRSDFNDQIAQLKLYSLDGRVQLNSEATTYLNLSFLKSGIYHLEIHFADGSISNKKVMIQK